MHISTAALSAATDATVRTGSQHHAAMHTSTDALCIPGTVALTTTVGAFTAATDTIADHTTDRTDSINTAVRHSTGSINTDGTSNRRACVRDSDPQSTPASEEGAIRMIFGYCFVNIITSFCVCVFC